MQLYNADCLEVLRGLPDNCIDLVITDPPYIVATGCCGLGHREYFTEIESMAEGFNIKVLDECVRVLKNINIYIWCSREQLPLYFDYFIKEKKANFDLLAWHKSNPIPTCRNVYLPDTEYLLFFRGRGVPLYGTMETKKKFYVTPTNKADKEKYGHPTIKPLEIIENLVINSSIRGGCVLDPFMGSGTTGAACKKHGRDFVGIEIDPHYFEIAKKRIEETGENVPEIAEQMKLF